jgi:hypothetical protein
VATRRQLGLLPKLRELAADQQEHKDVRRVAVAALGSLCDRESLDLLTELAARRADPMVDVAGRSLATRALAALAQIGPKDLRTRLGPLLAKGAAPGARVAAERSLASKATCRSN